MFFKKNKQLKEKGKLIERDLGFIEDTFGMICDMVAFEDHCDGSFLSNNNEENLKDKNWMRKLRTKALDSISKKCSGNDWCKLKHICRIAKGYQERASRLISTGELKMAKEEIKNYGECYLEFIKLTGGENGVSISSA